MSASTDSTNGSSDAPPPAKKKFPMWVILLIIGGLCVLGVPCVAIIAAIAIPNLLASKTAANQTRAVANLKTVATAQAQYMSRKNTYAASGTALAAEGQLIGNDLAGAFESHHSNGDTTMPQHSGEHLYRMLHGEGANAQSYVTATTPKGEMMLSSWAATSRPIGRSAGDKQYYITEAGVIWEAADPNSGTFILDAAPLPGQNLGWSARR